MLSLIQSLAKIGKQPPIRIPSGLSVPSRSLRETLNIWNPFQYGITIVTGTLKGAGTDANVYITLYGDCGQTGEFSLDNAENNFERRKTDYFEIVAPDVGELGHIRIRHDNSGNYPEWFLSKVIVANLRTQQEWTFYCNRWLAVHKEDRTIARILYPKTVCTEYRIRVVTGDLEGAGTFAGICITMRGDQGDSDEFFLNNGNMNFQRGQTDYFTIFAKIVGHLRSARIRLRSNPDFVPGPWFLSTLFICNWTTPSGWQVSSNQWFYPDTPRELALEEVSR
jgi:lipoxygenase homology domain-containing protein 1